MEMNALFVRDSKRSEVTWIGGLGLVFNRLRYHGKLATLQLMAAGSVIIINRKAILSAKQVGSIHIKDGRFDVTEVESVEKRGYPLVKIDLEDCGISFSIMFSGEHLDLFWHSTKLQRNNSQGLIGKQTPVSASSELIDAIAQDAMTC